MAWTRLLLAVVARVVLCVLVGLVLCSLAPTLIGWHSHVVLTGSMQPTMRTGDVVSYQPVPASRVEPGQVMLFHNPARPGQLLSHRFVRRLPDGTMVTRGDANGHDDSTPVPERSVIGIARMDIPRIGLPLVWWSQGQKERTGLSALVLVGTILLASTGIKKARRPEEADETGEPAVPEPRKPPEVPGPGADLEDTAQAEHAPRSGPKHAERDR